MRFIFTRALVLLLGLAMLMVATGYAMLRSDPAHWRLQQQWRSSTPRAERAAMAEQLQRHVVNGLLSLGDTDTAAARFRIPLDQANAWLELHLPGWLEHQGIALPREFSWPMLAPRAGGIVLAFRVDVPDLHQVVSVELRPRVLREGVVVLGVSHVQAGKLPLPMEALLAALRRGATDPQKQRDIEAFSAALRGGEIPARWRHSATRDALLSSVEVGPEAVEVVVVTRSR